MCGVARAAATLNLDTAKAVTTVDLGSGTVDGTTVPADFLSDAGHPLSIDDVARGRNRDEFRPLPNLDDEPYVTGWLRFSLRSTADPDRWLLVVPVSFGSAELYVRNQTGGYTRTSFGMRVPFNARPLRLLSYPSLPISSQLADGQPLYLHFTRHRAPLGVYAVKRDTALATDRDYGQLDFLWIGLYLAVAISNLLLFLYLRDRTFLAYAGAMCVIIVWLLSSAGHAWVVLWPWASLPFWDVIGVALGCWWLAIATFARSFLDLARRAPRLDKVVIAASIFAFFYTAVFEPFEPWTNPAWIWDWGDLLSASVMLGTLLYCGVILLRRGVTTARFYVIGLSGYVLGTVSAFARSIPAVEAFFGALPWPLSDPGQLGVAWEALFLTFAIADRVRAAKAETVARLEAQNISMERFVPRAFLEHLGRNSVEDLELGDHTVRDMTLLFSDIRSFTTLAESMKEHETFAFINSYLTRAGPVIREHGGFIDKYIGDAIMALFADSTDDALDAAIHLQTEVVRYNRDRARAGYKPIVIGVGLHHGTLALGAIGETARIETTVIADAVNVASRMESLTKLFGTGIVITDAVVSNLKSPERYHLRLLARVQVKGTTRALNVFEVFDADSSELIARKLQTREAFAAAVDAFAAGDFAHAQTLFSGICETTPEDRPAAHFAERCRELLAANLSETWDGVERLEIK